MRFDQEHPRLRGGGRLGGQAKTWLAKGLTIAATAIVLVSAVALSLVFLALAMSALIVFGVYFWWRTRHVRKELRRHFAQGEVIEGTVVSSYEVQHTLHLEDHRKRRR